QLGACQVLEAVLWQSQNEPRRRRRPPAARPRRGTTRPSSSSESARPRTYAIRLPHQEAQGPVGLDQGAVPERQSGHEVAAVDDRLSTKAEGQGGKSVTSPAQPPPTSWPLGWSGPSQEPSRR